MDIHDQNGLLTAHGLQLLGLCGAVLFSLATAVLAYLIVRGTAEDRYAMDCVARAALLSASRPDDKERRDDADAEGVVSTVRLELTRDLHRRPSASVQRLRAESREGRPVPPRAA
jgi:hypothetical protein